MRGQRFATAALGVLLLALTACTGGAERPSAAPSSTVPSAPPPPAAGTAAPPAHVVVVVFENKDARAVVGAPDAPYLTSLARSGLLFTDAHGVTHPSEPNYLALFSGSTHGVTDDSCPLRLSGDTLAGQLLSSGRTFVGWSEGLPREGAPACSAGRYARKHAPWTDFPDLPASVSRPMDELPADPAQWPTVSFLVPDLCSDMHDCPVATGDAWARDHLAGYASWAREHDSLLVVTFDENGGSAGNSVATFVTGAGVAPGTSSQRIDHYSLLRSIEDWYGLPPLGRAADAQPLAGVRG